MSNMNIRTPRFYPDLINYCLTRGVAQNTNFDVESGANLVDPETGTEADLFDMKPLNLVTFDTTVNSGNDHVLVNLDTQGSYKKSFVAILNHNLNTCTGKILIKASNTEANVQAVDMASATAMSSPAEVVNADAISSSIVTPATDGSTIVRFDESDLRFWGIQFEGDASFHASNKLTIGCIMIGEYYEMPHSPDLAVKRSIAFEGNDVVESIGGQRYSNLRSFGRTVSSTSRSPFSTTQYNWSIYGGRIIYDINFSYLNSTDVMPDEYNSLRKGDDAVVEDIWNKTNGSHIPFIFSCDKDSEGNDAESEHIFARFAQNSLDMTQVANDVWNVRMRIEEEF